MKNVAMQVTQRNKIANLNGLQKKKKGASNILVIVAT
jgi:hypothetical protein